MNSFHSFILFSICLAIIASSIFGFKLRKHLDHPHGMMITMIIGTNISLTVGVLFGTIYNGNLYTSTLISMAVGIFSGTICGLSFGLMGCLEGFMAGLMGSLMGAMLGAMISSSQAETILKILLSISICSILLFLIVPNRPKNERLIKSKRWFLKPLLTIILIASYLYIGAQLGNE